MESSCLFSKNVGWKTISVALISNQFSQHLLNFFIAKHTFPRYFFFYNRHAIETQYICLFSG